ncbi:formimidoylglutamase [Candidatus Kryptonium thompsonii]|uniref:formimidoylglutamase n=1 Tax=Candidatus Kryptonium thompsonii TaxID=1633631 RepID=UPI00159EF480|nr:formimidoylglutamase [Candidatus Kryptonium thompsoni]
MIREWVIWFFRDVKNFEGTKVAIIGVPQDEGVKRNQGRPGARKAPDEVRKYFYRLTPFNFKFEKQVTDLKIFDLGNLKTDGELEKIHERLIFVVEELIKNEILVIVIGGGHDIAFPDYLGFARNFEKRKKAVFNIDTHLDVRDSQVRNSGTPFRQILESEYKPDKMIEVGIQNYANSIYHFKYALEKGIKIFTLDDVREKGLDFILNAIELELKDHLVHLSFDVDSVRNADAPGVSATYPDGLKAEDVLKIALFCGLNLNVKILDIAEVNPEYDVDGKTARLAAFFILNFLTGVTNSGGWS